MELHYLTPNILHSTVSPCTRLAYDLTYIYSRPNNILAGTPGKYKEQYLNSFTDNKYAELAACDFILLLDPAGKPGMFFFNEKEFLRRFFPVGRVKTPRIEYIDFHDQGGLGIYTDDYKKSLGLTFHIPLFNDVPTCKIGQDIYNIYPGFFHQNVMLDFASDTTK